MATPVSGNHLYWKSNYPQPRMRNLTSDLHWCGFSKFKYIFFWILLKTFFIFSILCLHIINSSGFQILFFFSFCIVSIFSDVHASTFLLSVILQMPMSIFYMDAAQIQLFDSSIIHLCHLFVCDSFMYDLYMYHLFVRCFDFLKI